MARIHIAAFSPGQYTNYCSHNACVRNAHAFAMSMLSMAVGTAARPTRPNRPDRTNGRKSEKRLNNNGINEKKKKKKTNEKVASAYSTMLNRPKCLPNEPKMTHRVEQTTTNRRRRTLVFHFSLLELTKKNISGWED